MKARQLPHIVISLVLAVAALCVLTASASAKTYTDVPQTHWAYQYISSVTERSAGGHRLLDDYGTAFKPEQAITRELLARSIVLASGHYGQPYTPLEIKDVPAGYRYYTVIQQAVRLGYMSLNGGYFQPTREVTAATAEQVFIRWLKERYSTYDWSLLTTLQPKRWQPTTGWTTGAPSYLPAVVASRQLQLRFNHPSDADKHEVTPKQTIDRAEIAYMFSRAFQTGGEWQLWGLADYGNVTFPALSDRQKQVVQFALKYIGYPYIWGGEYPTKDSPYGYQQAGGFDCSGFVFYVMRMHFGYTSITLSQRGAHDMAGAAKPRITRDQLKCGDLIFFGPKGPDSSVESIYHAGLYLGRGWFIHSTGSSDGVTLQSLNTSSYYKAAFAWGRRVLTAGELVIPAPSPSPTPSTAPAASSAASSPSPEATASAPASPSPSATPQP